MNVVKKKYEEMCSNPSPAASSSDRNKIPRLIEMPLLLLAPLFYCILTTGDALILTRLEVPVVVDPRSETVVLRCEYDLEGTALYSVKWYKDDFEFFRYMPESSPSGLAFPVDGVEVDMKHSDSNQVTLLGQPNSLNGITLAGTYGCEVSTEGPNFLSQYRQANMSVAVLPKRDPVLEGVRLNYEVGEVLKAECTSAPSHPPAVLTFLLNDKEVSSELTRALPDGGGHIEGGLVSTTRLGLVLKLERRHFPGGSLSLICQSVLPSIPVARARTMEVSSTLAASNQRLAQEPPSHSASSIFKLQYVTAILLFGLTFTL